jgi:hypothetical protein
MVKARRIDNRPALIGYGGSSCGDSFFFGLNFWGSKSYVLSTHCDAYTLSVAYEIVPAPIWRHWVAVVDETGTKIYLDCQLIGEREGTPETYVAGTELGFGTISSPDGHTPYSDYNVGYLDGYLDDVRIYNRPFTEDEIRRLYDLESPLCPEVEVHVSHVQPSEVEVCWASRSNHTYSVEYQSNLMATAWLPLSTNVIGNCGVICLTDVLGPPQRFYRLICSPNSIAQ